jgi:lycopene cyclase domain-containing protein
MAIALGALAFRREPFLPAFFFTFLFILIPFTISNGILTGGFLGRTIVYYNDNENAGLRILTIPLEDIFYGKLLLLLNVYLYLLLKNRARQGA